MNGPELSLVVPVFNERDNLVPLADEIEAVAQRHGWAYELLLVNDGSDDGSEIAIDLLAANRRAVRGIHLDRNHGQSAAFAAGFAAARARRIVTLDADGQNDPADIPAMLDLLERCDVVAGYRLGRSDRAARRVASWIANRIRDAVTGDPVIDTGCSLKAFDAAAARGLLQYAGMHRFLPTLARMRGLRVVQHPVGHRARRHGRSKYGILGRAREGWSDLRAVRWMARRRLDFEVVRESESVGGGEVPVARDHTDVRTALD